MHSLQPCQIESDIQLHDQSKAAAQLCTAHYVSEEGVMCDASLIEYKQVFFLDEAHMATAHCFCRHPLGLQEFYVGISVLISGGPILLHAKNLCGLLDAHSPSLCRPPPLRSMLLLQYMVLSDVFWPMMMQPVSSLDEENSVFLDRSNCPVKTTLQAQALCSTPVWQFDISQLPCRG